MADHSGADLGLEVREYGICLLLIVPRRRLKTRRENSTRRHNSHIHHYLSKARRNPVRTRFWIGRFRSKLIDELASNCCGTGALPGNYSRPDLPSAHRSIYGDAREVVQFFQATRVGLTATPKARFIVDDKVEVERCEFLTIPAVDHQRLDGSDDDGSSEQFTGAACALEDDWFKFWQDDSKILHRLLCKLNAIND